MIWMDDDVETRGVGVLKLLGSDTGKAYLFPDFWDSSYLGSVEGLLELFKHDVDNGKPLFVASLNVQELGSIVKIVITASISSFKEISLTWLVDEVLDFTKVFVSTLSIAEDNL
jgi:hypothetical protein